MITRFAPSPTGRLHVGNIRTALHNWLLARGAGGRFVLRIDDTDAERSTEAFAQAIRDDLDWLGLTPDIIVRQSDRFALYEREFDRLRAAGRVYPAYESTQELDLKRKIARGRGLPPIYDRAALALGEADRARFEAQGVRPHWRFRLDHGAPIAWLDGVRGPQRFDPAALSDPVIRRADGSWLYMLPSVIDDIDLGITDIVRGEDHVSNSALQLQMFEALGAAPPRLAHEALLTGAEGKLSKRLGALDVDGLRGEGIEAVALLSLLARIGSSEAVEPVADLGPIVASFDLASLGRAPARFDLDELKAHNARTLHLLGFDAVRDRLPAGMGAEAWAAVRPNIATLTEAGDWQRIIAGPIGRSELAPEDRAFLAEAAALAAVIDWAGDPWHALTDRLKADGRKGRALFRPLRLALTGLDHGPEMAALLPLIGRDEAVRRLEAAAALD